MPMMFVALWTYTIGESVWMGVHSVADYGTFGYFSGFLKRSEGKKKKKENDFYFYFPQRRLKKKKNAEQRKTRPVTHRWTTNDTHTHDTDTRLDHDTHTHA